MENQARDTPSRSPRQIERAREAPVASDALPKYGGHGYVPQEQTVQKPAPPSETATLALQGISGVVLDAGDLEATRAFYTSIFRRHEGEWTETPHRLTFQSAGQRVEFLRRPHPRTIAHAGQHCAYRVNPGHLHAIADELATAGHTVSWWREDHPSEREVTAYVADPSGNIVQFVPSDDALLIDHYYVSVEDIEHGELFYVKALEGKIDTYYGYSTGDVLDAQRWASGDDSCAPWTRNAYVSFRTHAPNPTPAAQIFARFGEGYVGVTLTGQRLPEPPEEFLKATPRAIFSTAQPPREVVRYLDTVRISPVSLKYDGGKVRFRREGRSVYIRDRSGNFFQVDCSG